PDGLPHPATPRSRPAVLTVGGSAAWPRRVEKSDTPSTSTDVTTPDVRLRRPVSKCFRGRHFATSVRPLPGPYPRAGTKERQLSVDQTPRAHHQYGRGTLTFLLEQRDRPTVLGERGMDTGGTDRVEPAAVP